MRLGKLPATEDRRDLKFAAFKQTKKRIKQAPIHFGHSDLVRDWGMLGNDTYGDCVWAGAAHETKMLNALTGRSVIFTDEAVLSDYAACTGFDPTTGANDYGTNMRDAMNYRLNTGIVDASGTRHKIGGYCALNAGDFGELLQALYVFDCVAVGFEFPSSAWGQFDSGKPWTIRVGASIDGGHYVPAINRIHATTIDVVTWARLQAMSRGFYMKYNDESYGFFTEETLVNGKSPEGFNIQDFQNALISLGH